MEKIKIILTLSLCAFLLNCSKAPTKLRVGCKNFTEQLILGEITAQLIEKVAPEIPLERKWGFGSTPLIHQALASGEIDLYLEYTGTAEQLILKSSQPLTLSQIDQAYQTQYQARWISPLGFSNGYVLVALSSNPLPKKLSEFAAKSKEMKAGFNAEFANRPDGFPVLQKNYHLQFSNIRNLDVGLLYPALDEHQVDLISGFATDSRLAQPQYQVIEDDLHVSPRYEPVPVVKINALQRYPSLENTLRKLSGILDEKKMQQLNALVETQKQSTKQIASHFIESKIP